MKRNFWKILPFVLAIFAITPSYSVYKSQSVHDKSYVNDYNQGHSIEAHQMVSAYNSPARYDVEGAWDFFFAGSFIFWQPFEEYLDYASEIRVSAPSTTYQTGHVHEMSYKFKPGFKAALGMNFNYDNWTTWLEYTWLYMSESTTARAVPSTHEGLPLWISWQQATYYTSAKAKWKLRHNVIDWCLARPAYVGTRLTLTPQTGIRFKWGKQDFRPSYVLSSSSSVEINMKAHQSSWAIGPRVGLDANYLLGNGFRFISTNYLGILYQDFKATYKEPYATTPTLNYHDESDKDYALTINPELGLGFGWGSYFASNKWHFDIIARYDFQVFTNENRMYHLLREIDYNTYGYFPDQGPVGDLYLQGLTLTLRLDF